MKTRIESLANEPVAYHLHKNRNFFNKLEPARKDEEKSAFESVVDLESKLEGIYDD